MDFVLNSYRTHAAGYRMKDCGFWRECRARNLTRWPPESSDRLAANATAERRNKTVVRVPFQTLYYWLSLVSVGYVSKPLILERRVMVAGNGKTLLGLVEQETIE